MSPQPGARNAADDALGQALPCPAYAEARAWRRFARHTVDVPLGCRLWLSPPRDDGYGQFWASPDTLTLDQAEQLGDAEDATCEQLALFADLDDPAAAAEPQVERPKPWRAHRWAYAAAYGPIPPGQEVMHACDEPLCVRAEHLELGTTAENAWDRDARGRLVHRGKNGVMRYGKADRREQYGRAIALHEALVEAIRSGEPVDRFPGIVARVDDAGTGYDIPLGGPGE